MSGRVLRKLREEREIAKKEVEDSEEDEDEVDERKTGGAFLAMMDDSSSDEEESSGTSESLDDYRSDTINKVILLTEQNGDSGVTKLDTTTDNNKTGDEDEDLDALLAEFKHTDESLPVNPQASQDHVPWFQDIIDNFDARDLDFEFVTRSNLNVGGSAAKEQNASSNTNSRRSRQTCLFGQPREGWGRPPHYIGGGMGMESYENEKGQSLPFPYNLKVVDSNDDAKRNWMHFRNWYKFTYSDTYQKTLDIYKEIQQTGDVNALALFIADNPFVPEALLQLSKVAYQTNRKQEGFTLLLRSLWTYECSSLNNFSPHEKARFFLDSNLKENKPFFETLLYLLKVSSIAG